MGIFVKGKNKAAFGTRLTCPAIVQSPDGKAELCGAEKWSYVENLGPYRIRYKCKVCGRTVQYDYSANPGHPYAVLGKNKWQRIVDQYNKSR